MKKTLLSIGTIFLSFSSMSLVCAAPEDAKKETPKPPKLATIHIEGALNEGVDREASGGAFSFGKQQVTLAALLKKIKKAKDDADVKGLILKVDGPEIGMAKVSAIRRALQDFKASGKKIHIYFEEASTKEYLLAAAADDISMAPSGWLLLPGLRVEMTYMKDLFDWLGVKADVIHIGNFKTAYENFYRNDMSDGQKEAYGAILDGFYDEIVNTIAAGRKLKPDQVKAAIDTAIFPSPQAKTRGLIDFVEYEDQFTSRLKQNYGANVVVVEDYGKKQKEDLELNDFTAIFKIVGELTKKPEVPKGDKIAVIYAVGMINNGKSQDSMFGGQTMGSETMVKAIREAAEDNTVKAIVLRIDSPGGSGLASDEIWREVIRAKEKKPFVASMSDVAGSGGYYIAMAADSIVAEPGTITGSIGVIGMKMVLAGLYDKVGLHTQVIQRGKNAGMFSSASAYNEEERKTMTKLLESFYQDFVSKVAQGRKRSFEEIDKIAQGRIWTGNKAKEIGIVDEIGGLSTAIEIAKAKAGIEAGKDLPTLELPRPKSFFEEFEEGLPFNLQMQAQSSFGMDQAILGLPGARKAFQLFQQLVHMKDRALFLMPVDISWN